MNNKTAEEITEALGFLQEYSKCGIWHNYMTNDEGREIKLKTMYDSIDLVKKRIEELEAMVILKLDRPEHSKIVLTNKSGDTFTSTSEPLIDFLHDYPSTNGKQD
jgi:hypothetical protein